VGYKQKVPGSNSLVAGDKKKLTKFDMSSDEICKYINLALASLSTRQEQSK